MFIANDEGKAFYVLALPEKEDGDEETNLPETAEADFIWIPSNEWFAYDFPKKGEGYWKYNGEESTVVIPKQIEGENLIRYNGMFSNNSSVTKVVSTNQDVVSMAAMFMDSNVEKIDLSNLNVSKVENMAAMFQNSAATEIVLGPKFTGENVTITSAMFIDSNVEKIDLSNFNASKVESMIAMFRNSAATEIILGPKFTGENVTSTNAMFMNSNVNKIDLSNFNASKVENMISMFQNSAATEIILGPKFTGENVTTTNFMFMDSNVDKIDLSNFNASKVEDMRSMLRNSAATEIILGPKFTGENVTITNAMFMDSNVDKIDLSNFNASKVENMVSMFRNSAATEIILGPKFTGENVTTTNSMFMDSNVYKIDLSNFNASKIENMGSMFRNSAATEIILGPKFTSESVTAFHHMFEGASVSVLDLSSLDVTRKVGNGYKAKVDFMFSNSKLNTVYMNSASIARIKVYGSTKHITFIER